MTTATTISIITPCCRQKNLIFLYESIDFSLVDTWYIIYDVSKNRKYNKQFVEHKQIVELEYSDESSCSGNTQRNFGLTHVKEGFVYFLDDDNIVHPSFWKHAPKLDQNYFYTWDQDRNNNGKHILKGNNVQVEKIDTAMFIVPKYIIADLTWEKNKYGADGIFIETIYNLNKSKHVYIPEVLAYYNKLTKN